MPRNSSGIYTLLNAAFLPGTVISSSAVNGDLSDIATALTQSLATTGVSSMSGQIKAIDGMIGAPGYSFGSDVTTGIYRDTGAGTRLILDVSGTNAQISSATAVTVPLPWTGSSTVTSTGAFTASSTSTFSGAVTFNGTTYTFGAGAAAAFWAGLAPPVDIQLIINGGGAVIQTGNKGQVHIPFPLTINAWSVIAEQSGSIVCDILRANNGVPSVSIVGGGGNAPTLAAQQINSANAAGWTSTSLVTNDFIDFNVTSATTVQIVTVVLKCTRTG